MAAAGSSGPAAPGEADWLHRSGRAKVRATVSPTRPMPCASDDVIGITPRSCRTSSAAIVAARTRSRASRRVARQVGAQAVRGRRSSRVLGGRVAAERQGRVLVEDPMTFGTPASGARRAVPAAAALDVEGVDGRGRSRTASVSRTNIASLSPSVWRATCTSCSSANGQRGVERAGVRAGVLVHLEAADAAVHERLLERARAGTTSRGRATRC